MWFGCISKTMVRMQKYKQVKNICEGKHKHMHTQQICVPVYCIVCMYVCMYRSACMCLCVYMSLGLSKKQLTHPCAWLHKIREAKDFKRPKRKRIKTKSVSIPSELSLSNLEWTQKEHFPPCLTFAARSVRQVYQGQP